MKINCLLIAIAFCAISRSASSQDFRQQFSEAFKAKDSTKQLTVLKEWKKVKPNDPELYVSYFNCYVIRGLEPIVALTPYKPQGDSFEMKDKNKKVVGYLGNSDSFNDFLLDKGFAYIDTGIAKYPDRLDMRFGKVYVFGRIKRYNDFAAEIVKAVEYGNTIGYKWTWSNGQPLDEPKKFMLSTIQSYITQLFEAGDGQLHNMRSISEAVLKYDPDNVENLSDISITYMIEKDYPHALKYLTKAETLAPQDTVVLNNLAFCYAGLNNKIDAAKYYNLVIKYGDESTKEDARKKLNKLNEK